MIVDDHQIFIDGIRALLESESNIAVVASANNGKEAIKVLEEMAVDVVLIDIEMPIMNGYDTTAIITSKYPNTKVISLTTHDEKSIVNKMINAGASGYLLKNIDKETLLKAIKAVYNNISYFSSEIAVALQSRADEPEFKENRQLTSTAFLSLRETEILILIANGLSNNEVGQKLSLSAKTIGVHRTNIMRKLDVHNVVDLVKYAIKCRLI